MATAEKRSLPESQYDLSTYWGRVKHNIDITDPRNLFTTERQLAMSKDVLQSYQEGKLALNDARIWPAKKVVDSTIHPDTGEPVFLPFRMSCFVITNLFVTAGMLTPGLSNVGTAAWQVINQSVNVAFNFANSNRSTALSYSDIGKSYLMAVGASCGVAVGLNKAVERANFRPSIKLPLSRLTPFAAVASAGALNVFLMRGQEIRQGIDVYSEQGENLGKSSIAATIAVTQTAISRVLNSSPIMVVPPLVLLQLQKTKWLSQRPRFVLPCNLALILATSLAALPLAIAAFPQTQRIRVSDLEDKFHSLMKDNRDMYAVFNRGM